jgi:hypothetical protein
MFTNPQQLGGPKNSLPNLLFDVMPAQGHHNNMATNEFHQNTPVSEPLVKSQMAENVHKN